jgi:hypothetical protein
VQEPPPNTGILSAPASVHSAESTIRRPAKRSRVQHQVGESDRSSSGGPEADQRQLFHDKSAPLGGAVIAPAEETAQDPAYEAAGQSAVLLVVPEDLLGLVQA